METIHLVVEGVAALIALYVSYRLATFKNSMKEDLTKAIKENCASQDSFNAHVTQDAKEFQLVRDEANRRHDEVRADISKVEARVDTLISGARP